VSEYLVRWTFGANNQLRSNKREVVMYQFHKDKKEAVDHYVSLLNHTSPAMGMTTEIFQLVQLVPGESEPEDVDDEIVRQKGSVRKDRFLNLTTVRRDEEVMKMWHNGSSRREIANAMDLKYQTVYSIIRRLSDVK
jgi:DNA-directed RNA polymerase specialized sigma24 family protein